VYEEMPYLGRRTGITGRGLEGLTDGLLKVLGSEGGTAMCMTRGRSLSTLAVILLVPMLVGTTYKWVDPQGRCT